MYIYRESSSHHVQTAVCLPLPASGDSTDHTPIPSIRSQAHQGLGRHLSQGTQSSAYITQKIESQPRNSLIEPKSRLVSYLTSAQADSNMK